MSPEQPYVVTGIVAVIAAYVGLFLFKGLHLAAWVCGPDNMTCGSKSI
jgi:hypothetical protein